MTILTVIISAMFGMTLTVAIRKNKSNDRLRNRLKDEKREHSENVGRYARAMRHTSPLYYVRETMGSKPAVMRRCEIDGSVFDVFIKDFRDDDNDFNRREADELCEKLNDRQ